MAQDYPAIERASNNKNNKSVAAELLVSLKAVFVSSRSAPPLICWEGALRDETKTAARETTELDTNQMKKKNLNIILS